MIEIYTEQLLDNWDGYFELFEGSIIFKFLITK